MEKEIIISSKDSILPHHKAVHEPFEYLKYEVTPRGCQQQCYVCLYDIPPGKAGYPYHYHTANTEVFYIIAGQCILVTPKEEKAIKAGDVIVCPPGSTGAHKIVNTSPTEVLTYLDSDTTNSPDVVYYPDSEKIGLVVDGEDSTFFKCDSEVDYYCDE